MQGLIYIYIYIYMCVCVYVPLARKILILRVLLHGQQVIVPASLEEQVVKINYVCVYVPLARKILILRVFHKVNAQWSF